MTNWTEEELKYNNLQNSLKNTQLQIKQQKKILHQKFKEENKKKLIILDITIILILLFNIGVLTITNSLVLKNNPNQKIIEANPITAKNYNYKTNNEGKYVMTAFMFHCLIWIIIISYYLYNRFHITTKQELTIFTGYIIIYLIILGLDFFNDFGYLIGKLIWA